jgi:nitroreductase
MPDALHALLAERYGAAAVPPAAIDDAVIRTLLTHRSVRAYRPDPLPEGTLETLVAAAQSASTSSNLQAWSVVAVEDAGRRERLSRLVGNQAHVRECPLFLAWIADLSRFDAIGARHGRPPGASDYLELFLVAAIDAALAAQNAAIAAEALGLGVVYIGGLRNQPEAVAAELGLPARAFGVFGLCVGHPDPARPAAIKPRLAQRAVLHRERYDASALEADLDAYNGVLDGFFEGQGQARNGWDRTVAARVAGPESLSGRDRLAAALAALGFALR